MADEATVQLTLIINNGNVQYRSYPSSYRADVSGEMGPVSGAFAASAAGTDVDLSELTTPGFCRIANIGETYSFMVGVWSGSSFYPLALVAPGEFYLIKLSEFVGETFGTATSTATTGTGGTLRLKAIGGTASALLEVFER